MIWRATRGAILLAALAVAPAAAQEIEWQPLGEGPIEWQPLGQGQNQGQNQTGAPGPRQPGPAVSTGTEAVLRGLDKVSGAVRDLTVGVGQTVMLGRVEIALAACRFPTENPSSDAYGYLTITDARDSQRVFEGWMVASSPALNALDHARYDVWIVSCH